MERFLLGTSIPMACFPGIGGHDTNTGSRQPQGQIVLEIDDTGDLHPGEG